MTANFKPNVLKKRYALRLFVAGNATNSRIARENLEQLLARHPEHEFEVEIVDLNVQPEFALDQGVFISPALQILEPSSGGIVYGNLSQKEVLEKVLNL
ncbi:MAG TPA: circadian clock KaiB family protein, partial [Anaerolineales bacterium]|nr:circadian clock KaiB family protein [Anaerolineales bacterium]HND50127.1 circadian clock KaiB family protein [Anaerolineales bacterium]HNM37042.1 circadian clock KaiB family protein [Anaerolineales bacterium]